MPTAPQRTDTPAVFVTRADATVAAWPQFITETNTVAVEINTKSVNTDTNAAASAASAAAALVSQNAAAASAASAVATATTNGTSTTSLAIGTGSKTFTTQSSKNWVAGMWMTVSSAAGPTNYMYGYVTSYSGTTLIMTITQVGGSGTLADWVIALSAPQASILTPLTLSSVGASIKPSLLFDFANSKYFDSRISFTRATAGGRFNQLGLYESMAAGVPRLDYNPATGESLGLLVEEARTNLAIRSEAFDNASWVKGAGITAVTANTVMSPDGNTTADTVTCAANASSHNVNLDFTATAAAYTVSVFAKAGTATWLGLTSDPFASASGAYFDLANGVVGTVKAGATAAIQSVGNGWYRCSVTRTLTAATYTMDIEVHTSDNQAVNWSAAGTETIYIWGAQIELGGFATSYIPTTTVAVVRNIDVPSVASITSWYNALEGTIQMSCDNMSPAQVASRTMFQLDDAVNNDISGYLASTTGIVNMFVETAGVGQVGITAGTIVTANTQFKSSFSYKVNNFNLCRDASAVTNDAVGTVPTITTLRLGTGSSSNIPLNGHIKKFAYYPKQLSSAELVAITTA